MIYYDQDDYHREIIDEHQELLDKYLFQSIEHDLFFVKYFIGRDYTFGYDYINVYFFEPFQAVCFLLKHHKECMPK